MKKVVIAYRDNSLFAAGVKDIIDRLPSEVAFETIVFPFGTPAPQVHEELTQKLAAIPESFYYVSDRTCATWSLEGDIRQRIDAGEIRSLSNLDGAYGDAAKETLKSSTFEDGFQKLALLNTDTVSVAYVVSSNIADHIYGFKDEEDLYESRSVETFAALIASVLEKTYAGVSIRHVDTLADALADPEALLADSMIVVDRHALHRGVMDMWDRATYPHANALLMLPFENAAAHLIALGKLSGDDFSSPNLYDKIFGKADFS